MQSHKARLLGVFVATTMALTAVGVAPTVAQDEECRGGGADYWLENPWPEPFKVPKAFRKPNGQRALVRPWTKFDAVYRYRNGKDQEGRIFGDKSLKKVLKLERNAKQRLARQAIAALLNAGEPNNDFDRSRYSVIKDFQVWWDGTADMTKLQARKVMTERYIGWNNQACPLAEPA